MKTHMNLKLNSVRVTLRTGCKLLACGWMVLGARAFGAGDADTAAGVPAGSGSRAVAAGHLPPKFPGIPRKSIDFREPQREYEPVESNGWTIRVEKQLQSENPELAGKAVERLSKNLNESLALFPEHSRALLMKVNVFLMYGPKAKGGGRDNGAEYFQKRAPDSYKDLDPRWGHGLVVYSAENYVWQSELWALKLPLHELAHAYHLSQWPEDRAEICKAYDNAVKLKLYLNVRDDHDKTIKKAYAVHNPIEYFAELSCMYFSGCNYSPRNRKELAAYDPEGYAMIRELWGIKE